MNDDLHHAQASADWAVAQLPSLRKRLNDWLTTNVYTAVRKQPSNVSNNVLVAIEKEPLPLAFQVEVGAYVNAIRSSLDILAATLAYRHCQSLIDEAYFPIASSEVAFRDGIAKGKGLKGGKFVKALPARERAIIESLKPYKGGNKLLYSLHNLDIVRKHIRLLTVDIQPCMIKVSWWGTEPSGFIPVSTGWVRTGPDETTIGLIAKSLTQQPNIEFASQVSLGETAYFPHREVVTTLYEFSKMAKAIIGNFK
jgi:hypothetical protein